MGWLALALGDAIVAAVTVFWCCSRDLPVSRLTMFASLGGLGKVLLLLLSELVLLSLYLKF